MQVNRNQRKPLNTHNTQMLTQIHTYWHSHGDLVYKANRQERYHDIPPVTGFRQALYREPDLEQSLSIHAQFHTLNLGIAICIMAPVGTS